MPTIHPTARAIIGRLLEEWGNGPDSRDFLVDDLVSEVRDSPAITPTEAKLCGELRASIGEERWKSLRDLVISRRSGIAPLQQPSLSHLDALLREWRTDWAQSQDFLLDELLPGLCHAPLLTPGCWEAVCNLRDLLMASQWKELPDLFRAEWQRSRAEAMNVEEERARLDQARQQEMQESLERQEWWRAEQERWRIAQEKRREEAEEREREAWLRRVQNREQARLEEKRQREERERLAREAWQRKQQEQELRLAEQSRIERESQLRSIRSIAMDRGIRSLLHFTRLDNLSSILQHGLLSRGEIERRSLPVVVNDMERWDGRLDSISLSIEFPNFLMFYSCRSKARSAKWVVLRIRSEVLWECSCLFFSENAATSRSRNTPDHEAASAPALAACFDEHVRDKAGRVASRRELCIPIRFTTNPQAEVLVSKEIPPKYIEMICVENAGIIHEVHRELGKAGVKIEARGDLFGPRLDWSHWTGASPLEDSTGMAPDEDEESDWFEDITS